MSVCVCVCVCVCVWVPYLPAHLCLPVLNCSLSTTSGHVYRSLVGYMPQEIALYPSFTVWETLRFCARCVPSSSSFPSSSLPLLRLLTCFGLCTCCLRVQSAQPAQLRCRATCNVSLVAAGHYRPQGPLHLYVAALHACSHAATIPRRPF